MKNNGKENEPASMVETKQQLGRTGEMKAVQYLDRQGYRIICRNFRCRLGEVDIIAADGDTVCFIEVKSRNSLRHGLPSEAVNRNKIARIGHCAEVYLAKNRLNFESMRIDVVEVLKKKGKYYVRHIKNVTI